MNEAQKQGLACTGRALPNQPAITNKETHAQKRGPTQGEVTKAWRPIVSRPRKSSRPNESNSRVARAPKRANCVGGNGDRLQACPHREDGRWSRPINVAAGPLVMTRACDVRVCVSLLIRRPSLEDWLRSGPRVPCARGDHAWSGDRFQLHLVICLRLQASCATGRANACWARKHPRSHGMTYACGGERAPTKWSKEKCQGMKQTFLRTLNSAAWLPHWVVGVLFGCRWDLTNLH
jgi:hypothetical protein